MSNTRRAPRGEGVVKVLLQGGLMDGIDGEVVSPPPDELTFGEHGGFVYTLQHKPGSRTTVYRYDKLKTRAKLRHLGIPLHLVETATGDTGTAITVAAGIIDRPELAGTEVHVELQLWADRWDALVGGEVVATLERGELDPDDLEAVKGYALQVGKDVAASHRLEGAPA